MVLTPLWGIGGQDIDFLCVAQKINLGSSADVSRAPAWMQTSAIADRLQLRAMIDAHEKIPPLNGSGI